MYANIVFNRIFSFHTKLVIFSNSKSVYKSVSGIKYGVLCIVNPIVSQPTCLQDILKLTNHKLTLTHDCERINIIYCLWMDERVSD